MFFKLSLVLYLSAWLVSGQRPSFAGSKPIGFPELTDVSENPLANRFGDANAVLPVEAKGDRDLVNRIAQMPVDQQPFWYINWKAIEANNKNPQTYPQRGNSFIDREVNAGLNSGGSQSSGANSNNVANTSDLTSKFGASSQTPNANPSAGSQQRQNQNQGHRGYGY